ncbi:unnamed protein product [Phytomonas sp. Hart1]|nr:unnamed protein product [Phytomonas sp. Hart1]|eukprot:CCW70425.1 unnamed protein product [Phytomonas sp. isolate Hart1]
MHQMDDASKKKSYPEVQGVCGEISQLRDVNQNIQQRKSMAYGFIKSSTTLSRKSDSTISLRHDEAKETPSVRSSSPDPNGGDDDTEKCKSASSEPTTVATLSVLYEPAQTSKLANINHTEIFSNSLIEFNINSSRNVNDSPSLRSVGVAPMDDLATSCLPTLHYMPTHREIEHPSFPNSASDISINPEDLHSSKAISTSITVSTDVPPPLCSRIASLFSRQERIFESITMLEVSLNHNKMEHSQSDRSGKDCGGVCSSLVRNDSDSPSVGNEYAICTDTPIHHIPNNDMPLFLASRVPGMSERHEMTTHTDSLVSTNSMEASTLSKSNYTGHGRDAQEYESDIGDAFAMTIPPTQVVPSQSINPRGLFRRATQPYLTQMVLPALSQCPVYTEMQLSYSVLSYPNSYCPVLANESDSLNLKKIRRAHSAPPRISSSFCEESRNRLDDNDNSCGCSSRIKIPSIDCKRASYNHKPMFCGALENSIVGLHEVTASGFIASATQPYSLFYSGDIINRTLSATSIVVSSPSRLPSTERVSCVASSIFSFPPSIRGALRSTSTIVSTTVTPRSFSNSQSMRLPSLAHLSPRFSPRLCANEVEKQRGLYRLLHSTTHEATSSPPLSPVAAMKSISPEVAILTSDNTQNIDLISPMSAVVSTPSPSNDTCINKHFSGELLCSSDPVLATAPEFSHSTSPLPYIRAENLEGNSCCGTIGGENMGHNYPSCYDKGQPLIEASVQSLLLSDSMRMKTENGYGESQVSLDLLEVTSRLVLTLEEQDTKVSSSVSATAPSEEGSLACVNPHNRQDENQHEPPKTVAQEVVLSPPISEVVKSVPPVPVMRRPPIVPRVGLLSRSKDLTSSARVREEGKTAAAIMTSGGLEKAKDSNGTASSVSQNTTAKKFSYWSNYEVMHQLEHLPPAWRDLSPLPGMDYEVEMNTHPLIQEALCTEGAATPDKVRPWKRENGSDSDKRSSSRTSSNDEDTFTSEDSMTWGMPDRPVEHTNNCVTTRRWRPYHRDRIYLEEPSTYLSESNSMVSPSLSLSSSSLIPILSLRTDSLLDSQEHDQCESDGMTRLYKQGPSDHFNCDLQPLRHLHRSEIAENSDVAFIFEDTEEETPMETRKNGTSQVMMSNPVPKVRRGSVGIPNLNEVGVQDEFDSDDHEVSSMEWDVTQRLAELERFQVYNQEAMHLVRGGKHTSKSNLRGYSRMLGLTSSGDSIKGVRDNTSSQEPQLSVFDKAELPLRSTLRRHLRKKPKL